MTTDADLKEGKYRTIVADPPWDYADTSAGDGLWDREVSNAGSHYDQLSLADICSLPVLAMEDAYCFLWITNRHLLEGVGSFVLDRWGFRPITTFAWCKTQPGLGYYIRNSHENIAFGVRGSPGRFGSFFNSWITTPRTKHSEKPEKVYEMIEESCDGPYLELFARRDRPNWTCWGNELGDPLGIGFDPEGWG